MISNNQEYRQMIQQATQTIILFPNQYNQKKKSTHTQQCDILLQSLHPCRSSQQIENNILISHQTTQQTKQRMAKFHNQWPHSCLGLILGQHHQNNKIFYVYGTGTLISNNTVLTSAQNLYCRRLQTQYINIKFIAGISGSKCSGIYNVKRVHYPKEYRMLQYKNYDFAVLQLYDDLIKSYIGWKADYQPFTNKNLIGYGYMYDNKQKSFKLTEIIQFVKQLRNYEQQLDWNNQSGSVVLVKEAENNYFIVGIISSYEETGYTILSNKIWDVINEWTHFTIIDLYQHNFKNNVDVQVCKYLSKTNYIRLATINLNWNNISADGCKYLSQGNWIYLNRINLGNNKIDPQGCKHLSQANWKHLTEICLTRNKISSQGCKYISQANWTHLKIIKLVRNNIDVQGCKYLSQSNWKHLIYIDLAKNNICIQGCKYLIQTNWIQLTKIDLQYNKLNYSTDRIILKEFWKNALTHI